VGDKGDRGGGKDGGNGSAGNGSVDENGVGKGSSDDGGESESEVGKESSSGWPMTGDDRTELGWSDMGATDVIGVVASMHRGPLGQLRVGSDDGAVKGTWSTKFEAGDGAGEGSTSATGALATGFAGDAGISGAGGKGVQVGDKGANGAQQLQDVLCGGASCAGLSDDSGFDNTSANSGMK